jgi:hypothetical protein
MTKISVSPSRVLADLVERGTRIVQDGAQFERDIWMIRAESYAQLAGAVEVLRRENLDEATWQAARDYLADKKKNGALDDTVKALFAAATASLSVDADNQQALDLVERSGFCIELDKLYWKNVAVYNRSTGFAYLPDQPIFKALDAAFKQWSIDDGFAPVAVPEHPLYEGTTTIIRETAFNDMLGRGRRIWFDSSEFADDVSAIAIASYSQLARAARAFLDERGREDVSAVEAAEEFLDGHEAGDRLNEKVKALFEATRTYLAAVGRPVQTAIDLLKAAEVSKDLGDLETQAIELTNRAKKFEHMQKYPFYKALSVVFTRWLDQQGK